MEKPLVLVHVSGRRVAWSMDPLWFPRERASGPAFRKAQRRGRAGSGRESADALIRRLLRDGEVRGVLVTGQGIRAAYVTRQGGGSLRTVWSDTPEYWPTLDRNGAYAQARANGTAGVVYGAEALDQVLAGGIVPERDWRAEEAAARARKEARAPSLEDRARAGRVFDPAQVNDRATRRTPSHVRFLRTRNVA